MKNNTLSTSHLTELLYQALETEKGGVQIYSTALRCALNEDLREEWNKYLDQTREHVQVVSEILRISETTCTCSLVWSRYLFHSSLKSSLSAHRSAVE